MAEENRMAFIPIFQRGGRIERSATATQKNRRTVRRENESYDWTNLRTERTKFFPGRTVPKANHIVCNHKLIVVAASRKVLMTGGHDVTAITRKCGALNLVGMSSEAAYFLS